MSSEKPEFAVDQRVVYPSQGVGQVKEIFEKELNGKKVLYYKIYLDVSEMNVMVPVENASKLGIRQIVSAEDALKALDSLSDEIEPVTSDWKLRYQQNLDLLKKGSVYDIASIVRCLYHRSKVKELPILERKLYDSAKKLLEDEITFATGKPLAEVESMLHAKLEPLGAVLPKKAPVIDDDDDDDFEDEEADSKNDSEDSDDEDEDAEDSADSDDADDSEDSNDEEDDDSDEDEE